MAKQGNGNHPAADWFKSKSPLKGPALLGFLALTAMLQWIAASLTGHLFIAAANVFVIIVLAAWLIADRTALANVRKQADDARRTQTDFMANISHEIRTPLNAIIGFSELLDETPLDEEQAEYLDTILANSKNLLVMVNDILDFSKIKANQLRSIGEPTCMRALLERIEKTFYPQACRKGVDFSVCTNDDVPKAVVVDATRLMQCLTNLLGNALKFTTEGSVHVWVRTMSQNGRSMLRFDVEDTGIGVAPDQQGRIFEAFTQADGGMARRYGGLGLGLTLARRLADLLDGSVAFISEPGTGSTFSLTVPYQQCQVRFDECLESTLQRAV